MAVKCELGFHNTFTHAERILMQSLAEQNPRPFVERRGTGEAREGGPERRQFRATPDSSRPEVAEMAAAVDAYKARHRRRFITFDELYDVIAELGYHK
ncbi:hypothetical protein [Schlesneria paludicola]|uniref:hypothetical protein n=1 Tax=Schlesneria paludicola TaxID=360056 RepID=UPI001ED95C2C|nr:hypothetical protein [Schlesneria paludicola]